MNRLKYIFIALAISTLSAFVLIDTDAKKEAITVEEATEVQWMGWNEGYKEMMGTGKIGLIDMYTDWCGWCKRMDKDTYAKSDIIQRINKNFVPIKFNPEQNMTYYVDTFAMTGPQLKAWLLGKGGGGYPTTVFMIPATRTKMVESGYMGEAQFKTKLDEIVSKAESAKQ